MTTETETRATAAVEETGVEESPLVGALGKLGLASIGAVSLALETAEKLMQLMMERGAVEERNARRKLREFRASGPHLPRPHRPVIAVGTKNLASKADIQALEQQVAALSAQVEQLKKAAPEEA